MILARGAGDRVWRPDFYRPFHGLKDLLHHYTQGSAALHPGLYATARYRGLIEGFPRIARIQAEGKILSGKQEVDRLFHRLKVKDISTMKTKRSLTLQFSTFSFESA